MTAKTRTSVALIILCYVVWLLSHTSASLAPRLPTDSLTLNEMAGTWTDPTGAKGNHISFVWTKIKDAPGDPLALISSAYNCGGEITDLFGYQTIPFTFGFHSHAPTVVIFVNNKSEQTLMSLKATDHNHLIVRALSKEIFDARGDRTSKPLSEPPINLVRAEEPVYKPNYK